jgi:hypothetical protein
MGAHKCFSSLMSSNVETYAMKETENEKDLLLLTVMVKLRRTKD